MIFQIGNTKIQFVQFFDLHEKAAEAIAAAKKVAVLDIAFVADSDRSTFTATTAVAIKLIGEKLVAWIDHHPHEKWEEYVNDPRFILGDYQCTSPLVPFGGLRVCDLIITHGDVDGIFAVAKALGYSYPELETDAFAADTRQGKMSRFAQMASDALRSDMGDDETRYQIVAVIAGLLPEAVLREKAEKYAAVQARTTEVAKGYKIQGQVA